MVDTNEKTMTQTVNSDYFIIVHGVIPEAMPPVAYRRTGRPEQTNRKSIKCPYCKSILTDVDRQTKVQVFRYSKNKSNSSNPGQIFKHCEVCKNEIGIVMI